MPDVSMDYGIVQSMADGFRGSADSLHNVDQLLESAADVLRASAFIGMVGNYALAGYLDNIRPAVSRLAASCEELNSDLLGAIAALRDGDFSGSQRFVDDGAGGSNGAHGGGPASAGPGHQPGPPGSAVNIANYVNGQNGWKIIPIGGDFTANELVTQQGPSCTVYGAMNLLIENGVNISQAQADQLYQKELKSPDLAVIFDMMDGKQDEGFSTSHADAILDKYNVDYSHSDFSTYWGLGSPDRSKAESFLINQVQSGHPVYVTTEVDDTFGLGDGGHAYTVIGTQTDANGKLTNVLVATNWGSNPTYQIPANKFMADWMDYNDGEYIVINKK